MHKTKNDSSSTSDGISIPLIEREKSKHSPGRAKAGKRRSPGLVNENLKATAIVDKANIVLNFSNEFRHKNTSAPRPKDPEYFPMHCGCNLSDQSKNSQIRVIRTWNSIRELDLEREPNLSPTHGNNSPGFHREDSDKSLLKTSVDLNYIRRNLLILSTNQDI